MKIAPVLVALDDAGADTVLVHTGQHYDEAMSQVFFDELDIRTPDEHLERRLGLARGADGAGDGGVRSALSERVRPMSWSSSATSTRRSPARSSRPSPGCSSRTSRRVCAAATGACRKRSTASSPTGSATTSSRLRPTRSTTSAPRATAKTRSISSATSWSTRCCATSSALAPAVCRPSSGLQPQGYALLTLHRPSNVDDRPRWPGCSARWARSRVRSRSSSRRIPAPANAWPASTCPPGIVVTEPRGYLDFLALQADASGRADRLRRDPGGDHRAGRAVPDAAGDHGAPDHGHRGDESSSSAPIPTRSSRPRTPCCAARSRSAARRSGTALAAPRIARVHRRRRNSPRTGSGPRIARGLRAELLRAFVRVLFDIVHPAHVHFFKYLHADLVAEGHETLVIAREKDVTLALLDEYQHPVHDGRPIGPQRSRRSSPGADRARPHALPRRAALPARLRPDP